MNKNSKEASMLQKRDETIFLLHRTIEAWRTDRDQWRECAKMFWIATAPNGHCINIPVLKKALAEYDRLKEGK